MAVPRGQPNGVVSVVSLRTARRHATEPPPSDSILLAQLEPAQAPAHLLSAEPGPATSLRAATPAPWPGDRALRRSAASASVGSARTAHSTRAGRRKFRPCTSVMTLAEPETAPPDPALSPRWLRAHLPRGSPPTIGTVSRLPGPTSLRSAAIALPRFPPGPGARRRHARRGAVPLLRHPGREPPLAPLQQTHPCARTPCEPPSLRHSSICWIFGWAHGSPCSRRTKSRGRAPTLPRGDRRPRLVRSSAHLVNCGPEGPGPLLAATTTSRGGPLRSRETGPVAGRHLHVRCDSLAGRTP